MYSITFYKTQRGDKPVEDFMKTLDPHSLAKADQYIGLLREMGPLVKRPAADKLQGKIYELRPRQARILYFFYFGHEIILLHGFLKKTNEVKRSHMEIAERRRLDWIARNSISGGKK